MSGFNIGSDTQLTVISAGGLVTTASLTGFDARQRTDLLARACVDGVNRFRNFVLGWDLSFDYDRQDATFDTLMAAAETAEFLGAPQPIAIVTENTSNTDGSISIFRYTGVTFKFDSVGSRSGAAKIEGKISGTARRRIQVA